jgi:serine protease DegQ
MATETLSVLNSLSNDLSKAVEAAGKAVVRVDDGTRLTASGTIWTPDGLIVATSHGVERDEDLSVELHDGTRLSAEVVGRDPESDFAVLRAQGVGLPAIAKSTRPTLVGELAIAVARPGESGLHATLGMVGGLSEAGAPGQGFQFISTDAVMLPGFSGGALVGAGGEFLGLLNLGYRRGRGITVGAALVENVVGSIVEHGNVQRGYLGISSQPVRLRGGGHEVGLLISSVEPSSPAERTGLLIGDVLLTIDGAGFGDSGDLRRVLRAKRSGQNVSLEILRGGSKLDLVVELGSRN